MEWRNSNYYFTGIQWLRVLVIFFFCSADAKSAESVSPAQGYRRKTPKPDRGSISGPRTTMTKSKHLDEAYRWKLLWSGLPDFPHEHAITVDQFKIWRRHLVWAKSDGQRVRNHMIQRFSTNSVLLSLLVSAEIGIIYSPSIPANNIRAALKGNDFSNVNFWTGVVLCFSILLSISALYTNFTAWSIISAVSDNNAHALLRSSLGLYGAQTPSRLIVAAIYSFFLTVSLSLYVIMHWTWATGITIVGIILLIHVNSTYSALGRVIMETGAMGSDRIFSQAEEENMDPDDLYRELLRKLSQARLLGIPVNEQYRIDFQSSLGQVVPKTNKNDEGKEPPEISRHDSDGGENSSNLVAKN